MKTKTSPLWSATVVLVLSVVPALAQPKQPPPWLPLARNIIRWSREEDSDHSFDLSRAHEQLSALPHAQRVSGLRYLLIHLPIAAQSAGAAEELFGVEPTSANLDLILPKFKKWDSPSQEYFLTFIVEDKALFFPQFAQWRQMAREPLLLASKGKVGGEQALAVVVAALILAERLPVVAPDDQELLHQALQHNPTLPHLWNALALLGDVRPDEQKNARVLFTASENHPQLRLALAVALSPSDETMRLYVTRRLQSALKASEFVGKNMNITAQKGFHQLPQIPSTALEQTGDLRALRFWDASRARPFLARASRQSVVRERLFPIWALRFPEALLRVPTDAPQEGMGFPEAVVLAALHHNQWRRLAEKRIGKESFQAGIQELQESGIADVFGGSVSPSLF